MGIFSFFSKHEPDPPPSVDITSQLNRAVDVPKTERVGRDIVHPEEGPESDVESGAPTLKDVNINTAESSEEPLPNVPPVPMKSGIRLKQPSDEPPPETMAIPPSGVAAIEGAAAAPPPSVPPISRTPSGAIEISGKAMNAASEFPVKSIKTAPNQASVQFGANEEILSNPDNVPIGAGDQPLADGEADGAKKAA